jgi:hypothetical protein
LPQIIRNWKMQPNHHLRQRNERNVLTKIVILDYHEDLKVLLLFSRRRKEYIWKLDLLGYFLVLRDRGLGHSLGKKTRSVKVLSKHERI